MLSSTLKQNDCSWRPKKEEEAKTIADVMQKRDLSKVYVSNLSNYMTQKELAAFLNEHHVEGVKWVFRVFGDA